MTWLPVIRVATAVVVGKHQQDREVCPYFQLSHAQAPKAVQGPATGDT